MRQLQPFRAASFRARIRAQNMARMPEVLSKSFNRTQKLSGLHAREGKKEGWIMGKHEKEMYQILAHLKKSSELFTRLIENSMQTIACMEINEKLEQDDDSLEVDLSDLDMGDEENQTA